MSINNYLTGQTLRRFMNSERSGGFVLIFCTLISLALTNSDIGKYYLSIWDFHIGAHSFAHWINDGLMAIFFLFVGLELVQEIREGELSSIKRASLPIAAALGGMLVPAAIYLFFNYGKETEVGYGIPMATDIAFALGVLSLLGNRVSTSLKVFLTALAVIDDLGAILVIALFYTTTFSGISFLCSIAIFISLLLLNKVFNVKNIFPYILGGVLMWFFMLQSGIHATIAGVLLAITIPFEKKQPECLSNKMQHTLHYPVAFLILPLFALANTAITIEGGWEKSVGEPFALGIIAGLVAGKPIGIIIFSIIMVKLKLSALPNGVKWKEMIGAGMLGGIGFTMSIFITLLAFKENAHYINDSKLMILMASLVAGIAGYVWLSFVLKKNDEKDVIKL